MNVYLETRPAVGTGAARAFQVAHAGPTEYRIAGGGEQVWADSVDTETGRVVEAKYVGDSARSPFISGSGIPDAIRSRILAGQESEFFRYAQVISDPGNPLTGLHVITNDSAAGQYFGGLMQRFSIPGEVTVVP